MNTKNTGKEEGKSITDTNNTINNNNCYQYLPKTNTAVPTNSTSNIMSKLGGFQFAKPFINSQEYKDKDEMDIQIEKNISNSNNKDSVNNASDDGVTQNWIVKSSDSDTDVNEDAQPNNLSTSFSGS